MGRQSFTLEQTAIGGDVLLEILRNHLVTTTSDIQFGSDIIIKWSKGNVMDQMYQLLIRMRLLKSIVRFLQNHLWYPDLKRPHRSRLASLCALIFRTFFKSYVCL